MVWDKETEVSLPTYYYHLFQNHSARRFLEESSVFLRIPIGKPVKFLIYLFE